MADDMLEKMPKNYVDHEIKDALNRMGPLLPMAIFLRQELDRMQRVISTVLRQYSSVGFSIHFDCKFHFFSGASGVARLEIGNRRDDHHVTSPSASYGLHVRRSSAGNVEIHLMGEFHLGLLVYGIP